MLQIIKDKQLKKAIYLTLPFILINMTYALSFTGNFFTLYYRQQIHMSQTQVMTIQSIFLLISMLSQIPTGYLSDKIGLKKSMIISLAITSIAYVLYYFTKTYVQVLIPEALFAVSSALSGSATQALIYEILNKHNLTNKYHEIRQIRRNAYNTSTLISSVIVFKVARMFSPAQILMLNSIAPILSITILLLTKQGNEIKPEQKEIQSFKKQINEIKEALSALHKRPLRDYIIIQIIYVNLIYALYWLINNQVINIKFPIQYFGIVTSLPAIITLIPITYLTKKISDKRFVEPLHKFIYFSIIAVTIMLIFFESPYFIFLSLLLLEVPSALASNLYNALQQRQIVSALRSTTLSGIALIEDFTLAVLSPIWGKLFDWDIHITAFILTILVAALFIYSLTIDISPIYNEK